MAALSLTSFAPVFCSKPWTSFEVEHDGTVQPCCMGKVVCGNVNENSIEEIWNGPRYQAFRLHMASGEQDKICRPECPRLRGGIDDSVHDPLSPAFAENYARNEAEIASRALVLESWPRIWKTTASTRCNLDCIMCYQDRGDLRSLSPSFYRELEALFAYTQEIMIVGGEPFAIKRLRDLMYSFPQDRFPDARFSIVSNGTIHDERTINIVRRLRMSWMSISVDAATEPTYAHIRRGGNFQDTLKGIVKWIALGKESGFSVHMAFTVMRDNVHEMHLFAKLAHDLGADVLFGKVFGTKADQHLIDQDLLRTSVELTRCVVGPLQSVMPLANLTLSTLS